MEFAFLYQAQKHGSAHRQNAVVAKEGADVAKSTRDDIESRIGHTVISSERAIDHTNPEGMLPLNEAGPFSDKE